MLEREVDHAVGRARDAAQAVEIVERAALHLGAGGARAAADASERASPTTWWPAPISSGTTAEPIQPDAPVTKTRMRNLQGRPPRMGESGRLMSVTVITVAHGCQPLTSAGTIGRMARWEPDSRGRLEQAALELYGERGFEQTTVAEIAERAGLTERTFFRHFADKREVLFGGAADCRSCS